MLYQAKKYSSRVIDKSQITDFSDEWEDLIARSVEDNVYYTPRYALALLETVDCDREVKFVTVWNGEKLMGLMPVQLNALAFAGIRPHGKAWKTLYTFNCMPLLDKQDPEAIALALLMELERLKTGDWVIAAINLDGAVYNALTNALAQNHLPWRSHAHFERAFLTTGDSFETHMNEHVVSKRRKDLRRNRRRLEKLGTVTFEAHEDGPGLIRARDALLKLEADGWKGKRGTALACNEDTKEFADRVFSSDNTGRCRIDLLLLDGVPISAGVIVFCGQTGFTIKGAYDENYSGYSAGLLLEVEIINSFLSEKWTYCLDSSTSGKHVIDILWPGRRRVGDLVFSFSPSATSKGLSKYESSQAMISRAKSMAKRLIGRS